MSFVSAEFVIVVLVTVGVYYLPICRRWQPIILVAGGLFFYGYDDPHRVLLLAGSACLNFLASYVCLTSRDRRLQILATTVGVICNLLLLGVYKYGSAFAHTVGSEAGSTSENWSVLGGLVMPVGLSFFTFQGITLLVDALRNKIGTRFPEAHHPSLWEHGTATFLFICFFPTLLSGPIMKAHQFFPQIAVKRFKDIDWSLIIKGLILGYFLKMVIADNLKDQTFWLAYPYFLRFSSLNLLTMVLGYSIQIFADFAGYSLIAIALARLVGYQVPANFNFPYIATTFSDFWRRWHISLSTWLRDYLYFPLGGNRRGVVRTYLNLFLVMFLGGLWHGSTWNFGLWGAYHGILLMLERPFRDSRTLSAYRSLNLLRWGLVFSLVSAGWLFFKLDEFHHVVRFVQAVPANTDISVDHDKIRWTVLYCIPVAAYHLFYLLKQRSVGVRIISSDWWYAAMLFAIITCSGSSTPFIYFQF